MDEANTKAAVLRDFLDLLDWKIPTNTQLEYSVKAFGQTYKVDYALVLEGTPLAFLEAKGVDTALTEDHDEQLSSYMMNMNVNYGILTNGKQNRFFQRRVDASNVDVQLVGDVKLQDLPDRVGVLEAFSKGAIETGESGEILERINDFQEARVTLETEKDELAGEIDALLSDQVSNVISSLAESQAKEMIDRLIEDIESEVDSNGDDSDRTGGDNQMSDREVAGTEELRKEFWTQFRDRIEQSSTPLTSRKPRSVHYYSNPIGKSDFHISFVQTVEDSELRVELLIEDGEDAFWELKSEEEAIEDELGETVRWGDPRETRAGNMRSDISIARNGDLEKREEWQEYFDWFLKYGERFHEVFGDRIQQF